MGSVVDHEPKVQLLPVIDFSEESVGAAGTDSWFLICQNVRIAFEKYGGFEATNYPKFSLDLHNAILLETECLMDLPLDVKLKNNNPEKPFHGYIGGLPQNQFEALSLPDSTSLESVQSFAKLMWPDKDNQSFCDATDLYSKTVSELDELVMMMVCESYGLENNHHYKSHVDSTDYVLRFMKYRPLEDKEDELNCGLHTDKGMITILHHSQVGGLKVQTKQGDWVKCQYSSPTSFIIMAGDALMGWSNGRIHAAPHRVVTESRVKEARYTLAMFTFHKGLVQIPSELVDDQHPLQYKDFDNYDLLRYFFTLPDKTFSVTKLYCGISNPT